MNVSQQSHQMIPAADLLRLQALRISLATAVASAKALEADEKRLEADILSRLDQGCPLDPKGPRADILEYKRTIVAWREEFEKRLGRTEAIKVVEQTKPRTYREVLVGVEALIKRDLVQSLGSTRTGQILVAIWEAGGTPAMITQAIKAHGHQMGWAPAETAVTIAAVLEEFKTIGTPPIPRITGTPIRKAPRRRKP